MSQLFEGGFLRVDQRLEDLQPVRDVLLHGVRIRSAVPDRFDLARVATESQDRVAQRVSVFAQVEEDVLQTFALKLKKNLIIVITFLNTLTDYSTIMFSN
jgi:hypothetical protein